MSRITIPRSTLEKFLDPASIRAFEQITSDVSVDLPKSIDEVSTQVATVTNIANQAAAAIEVLQLIIDALIEEPVVQVQLEQMDTFIPVQQDSFDQSDAFMPPFSGLADALSNPTTYPADATDLPTAITLVNALKAAAIAKGL